MGRMPAGTDVAQAAARSVLVEAAGSEPQRDKGTHWDQVLFVLVAYRLLVPGSGWCPHRDWFQRSTLANLLGEDAALARKGRPCNELGLSGQGLSAACPHLCAPDAVPDGRTITRFPVGAADAHGAKIIMPHNGNREMSSDPAKQRSRAPQARLE